MIQFSKTQRLNTEVSPISRTPYCSCRRSPRCPHASRRTRRNCMNRWLSWLAVATLDRNGLKCGAGDVGEAGSRDRAQPQLKGQGGAMTQQRLKAGPVRVPAGSRFRYSDEHLSQCLTQLIEVVCFAHDQRRPLGMCHGTQSFIDVARNNDDGNTRM